MAKFDPKAKAKRQKIIAAVLGVVLVGVLIFQAPTIMSIFGGSSSTASESAPPPPPATTPPPATPGAPPAAPPAGVPPAAPSGGSAELVDSDPMPPASDGQLVSFDRFESKDPFLPQGEPAESPTTGQPPVPTDTADKADNTEAGSEPEPVAPTAAPKTATISVNGAESEVQVGGTFPESDPIFKLVSLKNGKAKVGIAGGSYANGSQTITLTKGGKAVTLMNTADGTTYVLRLVSIA